MHNVVGLRRQHGLDVVLTVAHYETISVATLGGRRHLLDLQALHRRDGELFGRLVGIIEDEATQISGRNTTEGEKFLLQGPLGKRRFGVHGC